MEVKQLANSQVLKSTTLADGSTAVGLGTLTLTTSAGSYDITIDSSNNTLDGLAEDINVADAGVPAPIITASDGARLVLRGGELGRAHVGTPTTTAHLVCLVLLEKKK